MSHLNLTIGIVGLPNVGKSTLFKALTRAKVDINNYPFCTIEPNVGVVKVPDVRLEKLSQMSESSKTIPAIVEFVDIAGLVKGASVGEGLGNKFLSHIREVDAIVEVVRVFPLQSGLPANGEITHVYGDINPQRDIEVINTEMILADLETVFKAEMRLQKEARGCDKEAPLKLEVTQKIKASLEKGILAISAGLDFSDEKVRRAARDLSLLTMKPFLYVYNVTDIHQTLPPELENYDHVKLDIKIEEELSDMSQEEVQELKMQSNLDKLILKSYEMLELITFFTTGKDETRAWTIAKDSKSPQAGSAIHTDFQEKFIRADIIAWDKLIEIGSWSKAKTLGVIRCEGKEYAVQDGEVIEFKI